MHEIGDILLRLNEEERLTLRLVEQKLPCARRVASHFCMLDKGRCVVTGAIAGLNDGAVRPQAAEPPVLIPALKRSTSASTYDARSVRSGPST